MKQPTDPLTLDMLIEQLVKLREDMSGDTEILIPDSPDLKRPLANAAWLNVVASATGSYRVSQDHARRKETQLAIVIN
jgi:hypothetical protein